MSFHRAMLVALLALPEIALAEGPPSPPVDAGAPDATALSSSAAAPAAPSTARSGYLVAPFENKSGVKQLDWMMSALAVTVAEKLESLPSLRPVYAAGVLDGMPAAFDATAMAARAGDRGARFVFGGSYTRPNWKAEVTLRLYETAVDGTLVEQVAATRTGERAQLLDLVDECLIEVLHKKALTVEGEGLAALHRRPTKDLYALTLFGRALNLYYGLGVAADAAAAEKHLQRIAVIDPKFAEAHRMLGVVLLARGESAKASGQYAYALDLKPGYYAAIVGLARLYRAEGRKEPSAEMARSALELRPWDDEMRFLLGELELEANDLDKALADLQMVVAEHGKHLGAHRALAQVFAARGEVEPLAAELTVVSELAPDDIDVRIDLGAALTRLGRNDKALAVFEDVLKRKPRNIQALKLAGDLYRKVGDRERAVAAYEKMRRYSPDDPRPYFLLAAAYEQAGNTDKAQAVLEDAAGQFHRYLGEVWIDLGALALRRGELGRAAIYLEKAVARVPNRPKAHYNYALVLDATNQRDKALVELRSAADLDPEDADIPYLAGVVLLRMGRLDEAKLEFAQALKLRPDHPDAKHNFALLEDLERRYGAEHATTGAR